MYMQTGDYIDYVRAAKDRDNLIKSTRELCREFERVLSRNIKTDPKAFWRYTNSKMKNRPKLGDLQQEDGLLTKDDSKKAQLLNNLFTSVFTKENMDNMPDLSQRPTKSQGPDGFHPRVLQETESSINLPLSLIFMKSLAEQILETWKTDNITPIHKKGKKTLPCKYRPVSLTSVVGKVMESFVRDRLVQHMTEGDYFCDAQYVFVPGHTGIMD